MMELLKANIEKLFGRKDGDSNIKISKRQKLIIKMGLGLLMVLGFSLVILVQEKQFANTSQNESLKTPISKIELPDSTIDTERRWREHFERSIARQRKHLEERLGVMEEEQERLVRQAKEIIDKDLQETKIKLELAQAELMSASMELNRVAKEEEERMKSVGARRESSIVAEEFEQEVEFDRPKSAENYVPEGTYFTGNLLGGIVVSTALNTPDENATPVVIRLTDRGNLNPLNKTDISKCRIMGSSYGDISSERAIIRLEKLVCERDGLYQTSKIAGQIFGPDGYNGIKGSVVSTSSKHIKNAMLGGIISGVSSSAKGQEGMSLTGAGIITTKKKGMGDLLGEGAMQGVSNAGEKLADYYLRQAESMSPVLTIPPGVRVNAQITKGFFIGESDTHKKIKNSKR